MRRMHSIPKQAALELFFTHARVSRKGQGSNLQGRGAAAEGFARRSSLHVFPS
jgi:hypothetical protein